LLVPTDPVAIERRYGAPMLFLQRATLHSALLEGGIEELVETDAEVIEVDEPNGRPRVTLRNGEEIWGDVLVGADGVRSAVRAALLDDGPPRSSGLLAYRAIIDSPQTELSSGEYWGSGRVFGLVPVDGDRLYWFATRQGSDGEPPEADPIPGLLERHRGWVPEITKVIEATESPSVVRHELLDRKPIKSWADGRVALLGDAAHPMLPFLGQGACQALEDAQALGQALETTDDIPTALRAYQEQRQRRAARVMVASKRMGRLAHMRSTPVRAVRDRAISMAPEWARMRQLDSVIGKP
jgi:2-polyprenyl-6-methoxyphenol hydroxylase-like FAD-dependent oxidoreductase